MYQVLVNSVTTGEYFGQPLNQEYSVVPGYQINTDGYGLVTMTLRLRADVANRLSFDSDFKRGDECPMNEYKTMSLMKASYTVDEGNLISVNADYVGIANGASATDPIVTVTSSTVSEAIESHPNFNKLVVAGIGDVLAGYPTTNLDLAKNNAYWVSAPKGQGAVSNFQFVGFLPTQNSEKPINIKAGIKSFVRPSVTMRVVFYTSDVTIAKNVVKSCGFVFSGEFSELGGRAPYSQIAAEISSKLKVVDSSVPKSGRNWLCTGSNMEMYGAIYKCQFDLMLSGHYGWDADIYPKWGTK